MKSNIKPYELTILLNEDATPEDVAKYNKIVETHTDVQKFEDWGIKRLAYPINYHDKGRFLFYTVEAGSDAPDELSKILNTDAEVMRYLIVRCDANHYKRGQA